ncbi:MAG: bifunctional 4-hydroxy-2-oxoglutarate aldolase/2-dehydro-3-deoxy-phosphogluconate aldolase [Coprobacillus cateniformis]|nr:bifunctional 4-hydroxy-2-oxoglutarate aldolase/2-dehydro-3-deoxy-phosphogluconate aldolase [Coprobacillus cateniformis]
MIKENQSFPKVTVILRGYRYESVRAVVKQMVGTKLQAVEITMNSDDAASTIQKIADEFGKGICVGAGTVMNLAQAKEAVEAGAQFVLSPVKLSKEIIDYCHAHGVITVPAAMTPSEIQELLENGADIVKVFPAARLTPQYIKDVMAPLGRIPLMVVGGINGLNAQDYFDAGARFAGIGSGIFDKKDIEDANEENLKKSILAFVQQISWGD